MSARDPAHGTDASEPSPRRVGRYIVLGKLGSGGMGVVFEGYDEQLGRKVAIKRLVRRRGVAAHDRSLREGQALARLAHPNVVGVHEVVDMGDEVYIVMELVAGRTLRAWLDARRPGRPEILDVLMQAGRGVAAAHAAGLVHRDFKPDNIMVGDDGRVRVMDFGLARATDSHESDGDIDPTVSSGPSVLSATVTVAGAKLGTPGYMSPEQHLGRAVDARSDIFGFCVVLFEALHGARPFLGRDPIEVREATLRGRIDASPGGDVPAWLDAVIRRGLSVEPEARWPSMSALLDALARDPLARRRRLLRTAGLALTVGALAAGLSFAYVAREQARARERAEELAEARLVATQAAIARAEADGDAGAAEAAFRVFVTDPAHRGTRALALAWQRRGDRRRGDPAAAQAAYAEAYVEAQDPADARAILRSMSAMFHQARDGQALGRTLALLRARGADHDAALADLGLDAALWQRDLSGAVVELDHPEHPRAAWRPLLAHLAGARATTFATSGVSVLPPGGRARLVARGHDGHDFVLYDASLAEVGRWRGDGGANRLVPGTSWVVTHANGEAAALDLLAPQAELWRGGSPDSIFRAFAYDATSDGAPELFFGRSSPTLGFRRLDGIGGRAVTERVAHPGTDAADSALEAAVVADLDGDGVDELTAAIGPWHSFDLRVFRAGAGGELELLTRRRFGRVGALASVRVGDRRLLVAVNDGSCPAPELFPEPPHTGAALGVHLLQWTGSELAEVDFVPLPVADSGDRLHVRDGAAGDLDGDDRDDLAIDLSIEGRAWTMLLRQTAAGGFESTLLAGARPLAAAQLDDDPAHELLISLGAEARLHALGLGDARLPDLREHVADDRPAPATLVDPVLAARWSRAEDLAALGLRASAAASMREAAGLAADGRAQLDLLDRAAELLAEVGDDAAELAADRRVRDEPALAARALTRSARALVRLGRYDDAHRDAAALAGAPGRTPEQETLARALLAELTPLIATAARVDLRFDAPLSPAWRLLRPGAVRRDPTRQALALQIAAAADPVAELPIEWDGGPVSLEYELDIDRLEYGSCIRLALVDATGAPWLGAGTCSMGGGGRLMHIGRWTVGGSGWADLTPRLVASAVHPRRVVVRVAYFPEREVAECAYDDGEGVLRQTITGVAPPRPGRHRLTIGAGVYNLAPSLATGDLRRVVVRGARVAAPAPGDVAGMRAAWLLAENEPRAALAALDGAAAAHPRAAQLRLLAHDALGDLGGLTAAAPAVLEHMSDPTWLTDLALDLRTRPLAGAALRGAAGASILPALGAVWSLVETHRDDPDIRRRALQELHGVESLVPRTAEERLAQRELLHTRGRMWRRIGDRERARRDLEAAAAIAFADDGRGDDRDVLVRVHLELAQLLAADAPTTAREHAIVALHLSATPEDTLDRLLAIPEIGAQLGAVASFRDATRP